RRARPRAGAPRRRRRPWPRRRARARAPRRGGRARRSRAGTRRGRRRAASAGEGPQPPRPPSRGAQRQPLRTTARPPGDSVSVRCVRGPSRSTFARGLLVWAGLAVSALFAYLAVRDVRFGGMWHALSDSNFWWLVPSLAVLALCVALRALRWQFLFSR